MRSNWVELNFNEFLSLADGVEGLVNQIDAAVGGLVCGAVNATTGLASGVTNTVGSSKLKHIQSNVFSMIESNLTTKIFTIFAAVASATGAQAVGNAISGLDLSSLNSEYRLCKQFSSLRELANCSFFHFSDLGCSLKGILAPVANLVGGKFSLSFSSFQVFGIFNEKCFLQFHPLALANEIGGNNCSANATLLGN